MNDLTPVVANRPNSTLMKLKALFLATLCASALLARADVPGAEKLLPDDTLAMISVPDWQKARSAYAEFPMSQLWKDPAMKPFTDKFSKKLDSDLIQPLQQQLGVKFADYNELLRGQVTLAFIQNGWQGDSEVDPSLVLLIDTKDKSDQSQKLLADVKKKWTDAGKQIKTDKVRDVEFTTLVLSSDDLNKAFENAFQDKNKAPKSTDEDNKAKEPAKKIEISIGQSGSLLMIGSNTKVFERILARLSGGTVASLSDVPSFDANYSSMFRDAMSYGWVNIKTLVDIGVKAAASKQTGEKNPDNPLAAMTPGKWVDAFGLNGIKTLAVNGKITPEGGMAQFFIGAPQDQRKGVLKLIAFEAKESSPPAFVPADVAKFSRIRLDGQKVWASIEGIVSDISPQFSALLQMTMSTAGKDKDPNFDLKKQLIGNLGDDMVSFNKNPRDNSLESLTDPPSLLLIGSPNADKLTEAFRSGSAFLGAAGGEGLKEREFLGRKVYALPMPPKLSADGTKTVDRSLSFSSSGGYLALSTDTPIVEEYLRSSEKPGHPLRETPGLNEAAEKVGGMNLGFFGYENQTETLRITLEALRQDPDTFDKLFPSNPVAGMPRTSNSQARKEWLDFSLLPPFDKIAKYFYFTVYSGAVTPEGFVFKSFAPMPPQMHK